MKVFSDPYKEVAGARFFLCNSPEMMGHLQFGQLFVIELPANI